MAQRSLPHFQSTAILLGSGGCRLASETAISLGPQYASSEPPPSFPMPPDPLLATHHSPLSFSRRWGCPHYPEEIVHAQSLCWTRGANTRSKHWAGEANTGRPKSELGARSKYWTPGVLDTGHPERVLGARSRGGGGSSAEPYHQEPRKFQVAGSIAGD